MVDVVKWISLLQLVHYALSDFRNLALTGGSPDYWLDVRILLGTGSIAFVLLYVFCAGERNEMQRRGVDKAMFLLYSKKRI